jgi:hypothetical protein
MLSVPAADVPLSNATEADAVPDAAHDQMVALALLDGTKGVLLTRHSHRHYTFTLSNLFPFGQTQERNASSQYTDDVAGGSASPDPDTAHNRTIEQVGPRRVGK